MKAIEVKHLWDERARQLPDRATTDDIWLRELEARTLISEIKSHYVFPRIIIDAGCGDGKTTLRIAKAFPESFVLGLDYSEAMLDLAETNKIRAAIGNCTFKLQDISKKHNLSKDDVDVVTTTRTLINLVTTEDQMYALKNLVGMGRVLVGIENFVDEQINFELLRESNGLHRILVHGHNLYLEESVVKEQFPGAVVKNFANAYYYATRIVYSKMCSLQGTIPDYDHDIHKLAIDLTELDSPAIAPMKLVTIKNFGRGNQERQPSLTTMT